MKNEIKIGSLYSFLGHPGERELCLVVFEKDDKVKLFCNGPTIKKPFFVWMLSRFLNCKDIYELLSD